MSKKTNTTSLLHKIHSFSLNSIGSIKFKRAFITVQSFPQSTAGNYRNYASLGGVSTNSSLQSSFIPTLATTNLQVSGAKNDSKGEMVTYELPMQPKESYNYDIEMNLQACPKYLLREFGRLFPEADIQKNGCTVVTIAQKTKHDMSEWSTEVSDERDQLLDNFISVAMVLSQGLMNAGQWANFIDPSSGLPFFGEQKNEMFIETDESLTHFGFEIKDLGCCKVISHKKWGTHAYVGVLFTMASPEQIKQVTNAITQNH